MNHHLEDCVKWHQLKDRLRKLISENLEVDGQPISAEDLDFSTRLIDLGVSSMDLVSFAGVIQDEFNVKFTPEHCDELQKLVGSGRIRGCQRRLMLGPSQLWAPDSACLLTLSGGGVPCAKSAPSLYLHVDLTPHAGREASALSWLDQDELSRSRRFLYPGPSRRFVLCRSALRAILCGQLGFDNRQLTFGRIPLWQTLCYVRR